MLRSIVAIIAFVIPLTLQAELKFEPATVNLGDVKTGQFETKVVKVTNLGRQKIVIRELKSTCGCIRPRLNPGELAPDGIGSLELSVNTLGSNPGPNVYRVQIRYQEGDREGESTFLVTAHVRQEVTVNPATLTVFGDRLVKQKFEVKDKRAKALKVIKVEATHPNLLAAIEPLPAGSGLETAGIISLEIKSGWPAGRHEHDIVLHTDDPMNPVLKIQVSIISKAKSRYATSPMLVSLSTQSEANQALQQRKLLLRDQHATEPINILKFEVTPGITASVQSQNPGSVIILVSLDPQTPVKGPLDAELRIHIQGESAPVRVLVNVD